MSKSASTNTPAPPDKGSFPLDHFGECQPVMRAYLKCLEDVGGETRTSECRELSKQYLKCRMDRGLMAEEDLRVLGFREDANTTPVTPPSSDQ